MAKEKTALPQLYGEVLMRRLAREIAMDQHDLERILIQNSVTPAEFRRISKMPRFVQVLQEELNAWHTASNTPERVKIKAAAMIEEWLPEAFAQMHGEASLQHKTQLATLVSRLGGMDKGEMGQQVGGERFSVTINLGNDSKLEFDKQQLPMKVIEGETNNV